MTRLIPEKRMNKNGVAVTKHVRADGNTKVSSSALPGPKLPPAAPKKTNAKQPSKAQLKVMVYRVAIADIHYVSRALMSKLGVNLYLGYYYTFDASASQCYEVMSVTSPGNALSLLHSGIKNAKDAIEYLDRNGFSGFIEDNSEYTRQGLERGIPVHTYISELGKASDGDTENPLFWDSVEVGSNKSLSGCKGLPSKIKEGKIRLDDVKAVGVTRIKKSEGWEYVEPALEGIASGDDRLSIQDLKLLIDAYGQEKTYLKNSLELSKDFDAEFVAGLDHPSLKFVHFNREMREEGIAAEKRMSVLRYFADLRAVDLESRSKFEVNKDNVLRFHDAGVNPEDAFHGKITLNQIDAMEYNGITPSLSGGWL